MNPFNLKRWKSDLWLAASLRNLKDEVYKDQQKKIAKGIDTVAVKTIYDQVLHLENVILPQIEKNRGTGSADYKFFKGVWVSLLYAVTLVDRNEAVLLRLSSQQMLLEFYRDHAEKLERHFNKYHTMEDFILSTGLDSMAEGIYQRAADLLEKK